MSAEELAKLQHRIRRCRLCADHGHPIASRPVFSGGPDARVMLVGQAPGITEAASGLPFSGDAGRRLFAWLEEAGFSEREFRERHYMTSVTRCYPDKHPSGRGDRSPSREEQKLCRTYLEAELAILQPALIIPVGRHAIRALLGAKPLDEVVGSAQQDAEGRWLVPLPHPSGASGWLNAPAHRDQLRRGLRHLGRLRRRLGLGRT